MRLWPILVCGDSEQDVSLLAQVIRTRLGCVPYIANTREHAAKILDEYAIHGVLFVPGGSWRTKVLRKIFKEIPVIAYDVRGSMDVPMCGEALWLPETTPMSAMLTAMRSMLLRRRNARKEEAAA